ncbi:hypothetical protein GCM10028861_07110 [Flavobacterium koreense]
MSASLIGVVFNGVLSIFAGFVPTIGANDGLQLESASATTAEIKKGFINFIIIILKNWFKSI